MTRNQRYYELDALTPGRAVLYEYRFWLLPYTRGASHRGRILWRDTPGADEFHFLALNDDSAFAHLKEAFRPNDRRPLRPSVYLSSYRVRAWHVDDPGLVATGLLVQPGDIPPERLNL